MVIIMYTNIILDRTSKCLKKYLALDYKDR